jgi:hypothetical protein
MLEVYWKQENLVIHKKDAKCSDIIENVAFQN